jgi:hypothetical protein
VPADSKERLALALCREAISIDHAPLEFLGYFKIVNIRHATMANQRDWINSVEPSLAGDGVQSRVAELKAAGENIGEYLYVSGRCAVAHAFSDPIVDPDDPAHVMRLRKDLPIARALAEYLLDHDFKIARRKHYVR